MELRQLAHVVHSSANKKIHSTAIPSAVEKIPAVERAVNTADPQLVRLADVFDERGDGSSEGARGAEAPAEFGSQRGAGPAAGEGHVDSQWLTPAALHSLCFPSNLELLADPTVPLQPLGTVVTSQAWDLAVPVEVGTALELAAHVVALSRNASGMRVVIECTLARSGSIYYTKCTSYLDKSGKGSEGSIGRVPDLLGQVPTLREDFGTNGSGHLDIGQRTAHSSAHFGAHVSKNWARITGDINPIHVSRAAARVFGYKSLILHGAAIDAWVASDLKIDGSKAAQGAAAFRAPVLLPARLEIVQLAHDRFAVLEAGSGRDLVHLWYSGKHSISDSGEAIVLPRRDGRSSSTLVAQGICAGAAAGFPRLRQSIDAAVPWRKRYREAMEEMSWFDAPERGAECAQRGLDTLSELLHFSDGRKLSSAILREPASAGGVITGAGSAAQPRLELNIDGRALNSHELVEELDAWQKAGRLQAGADTALREVALNPDLLRAEGVTFVCLGAGAELSPARQLLQWGLDVAAVIRPNSKRRPKLLDVAENSSGRLFLPPDDAADVVEAPERVAGWIAGLPGRLVIVDSIYAPGAAFLLAAAGADVVERLVCRVRPDTRLAWIGSPTDSYRLPGDGAAGELGRGKLATSVAGYAAVRRVRPGRVGGVYSGFVYLQGPNYAAAKRIGRWRATVERTAGRPVSYNVGPMSLTSSVTDNATLKTAYAGLARLGMPPLESEISATLMAALLMWDIHTPEAQRNSDTFLTDKAIDCGFFSCPYEPNGLMELAVMLGAGGSVSSRVRGLLRPKKASS